MNIPLYCKWSGWQKHTSLNYSHDIVFVFVFCICIYGGWQKRTALNRSHNSLLQAAWEV